MTSLEKSFNMPQKKVEEEVGVMEAEPTTTLETGEEVSPKAKAAYDFIKRYGGEVWKDELSKKTEKGTLIKFLEEAQPGKPPMLNAKWNEENQEYDFVERFGPTLG